MTDSASDMLRDVNEALFTRGETDAIDRYFSSSYTAHFTDGRITGLESIRKVVRVILNAFPQIEVDVNVLVEGSGRIAWQRTMRGKQTGAFKGFPASGKTICWADMIVSEIRDGKIVEEWVVTDLAERLLLSRKR